VIFINHCDFINVTAVEARALAGTTIGFSNCNMLEVVDDDGGDETKGASNTGRQRFWSVQKPTLERNAWFCRPAIHHGGA
jgi:hypothetical protein